MEAICRLCNERHELCRSHIIPEFLYRPLYDDKHRYFVVSVGEERDRYAQKGLTEALLCRRCEQHLGRYEKYAAEMMTGSLGHRYKNLGNRIYISNIDYRRFKLFQLSILWRGAISSLEFFRLISLGPHEERLRQMLLCDEPGHPHEYGCAVVFASDDGKDVSDTMFNPAPLRWEGRRMVRFFFAGSAWLFYCDKRPASAYLQNLFLQPDGTLKGVTGDLVEAKALGTLAKRAARRFRL